MQLEAANGLEKLRQARRGTEQAPSNQLGPIDDEKAQLSRSREYISRRISELEALDRARDATLASVQADRVALNRWCRRLVTRLSRADLVAFVEKLQEQFPFAAGQRGILCFDSGPYSDADYNKHAPLLESSFFGAGQIARVSEGTIVFWSADINAGPPMFSVYQIQRGTNKGTFFLPWEGISGSSLSDLPLVPQPSAF